MVEDIIEMEKSGQVYNANMLFPWPPPKFTQINAESFECSTTIPCVGAFLCIQQVIQDMVEWQKGTLLFTGATASMCAGAGFSGLGVVFFLTLVSLPSNEPHFSQIFRMVFFLSVYHWGASGKFLVGNLH
ncbi:hypothetical protein BDL97_09G104700 [Sphagnum fallax]|nr:hypothetical protein BDL97_09G104700 [Sphagnum fallax]